MDPQEMSTIAVSSDEETDRLDLLMKNRVRVRNQCKKKVISNNPALENAFGFELRYITRFDEISNYPTLFCTMVHPDHSEGVDDYFRWKADLLNGSLTITFRRSPFPKTLYGPHGNRFETTSRHCLLLLIDEEPTVILEYFGSRK